MGEKVQRGYKRTLAQARFQAMTGFERMADLKMLFEENHPELAVGCEVIMELLGQAVLGIEVIGDIAWAMTPAKFDSYRGVVANHEDADV